MELFDFIVGGGLCVAPQDSPAKDPKLFTYYCCNNQNGRAWKPAPTYEYNKINKTKGLLLWQRSKDHAYFPIKWVHDFALHFTLTLKLNIK